MPTRHDLDLDVMPPSRIGEHLLASEISDGA
jgi:hypothetical protein